MVTGALLYQRKSCSELSETRKAKVIGEIESEACSTLTRSWVGTFQRLDSSVQLTALSYVTSMLRSIFTKSNTGNKKA